MFSKKSINEIAETMCGIVKHLETENKQLWTMLHNDAKLVSKLKEQNKQLSMENAELKERMTCFVNCRREA